MCDKKYIIMQKKKKNSKKYIRYSKLNFLILLKFASNLKSTDFPRSLSLRSKSSQSRNFLLGSH